MTELSDQIKTNKRMERAKQISHGIPCPQCGERKSKRYTTRPLKDKPAIYRLRECTNCKFHFRTVEQIVAVNEIIVLKRDGRREPFDLEKLKKSMTSAIKERAIAPERVNRICQQILAIIDKKEVLQKVVTSAQLGALVMTSLKALDHIAYIRYASVHKRFNSAKDYVDFANQLV